MARRRLAAVERNRRFLRRRRRIIETYSAMIFRIMDTYSTMIFADDIMQRGGVKVS